jgi:hypothetical protein
LHHALQWITFVHAAIQSAEEVGMPSQNGAAKAERPKTAANAGKRPACLRRGTALLPAPAGRFLRRKKKIFVIKE